jgi:hypothetical protein
VNVRSVVIVKTAAFATGALCVIERDAPTVVELQRIQQEVSRARDATPLGHVLGVDADTRHSRLDARLVLADDHAIAYAKERWGNKVRLTSALRPVK